MEIIGAVSAWIRRLRLYEASISTSKMDHGMESDDGQMMDQEWNQMFEMMERAELSDFVVKPSL